MPQDSSPVWFITGCSTGFGRELAQQVLAKGWRAVVTARDSSRVADLVAGHGSRALALALDVTNEGQVSAAVRTAEAHFGKIDVLVNNAGYGYQSSVEEGVEREIRAMFDANVFGLFALTRAVLPGMRKHRRGYIINITSLAGVVGFGASGYYAATKHAVEGWSDSLQAEYGHLGIRVTCVEPGPFRTDWAGRSLHQTPCTIDDLQESAGKRLQATHDISGRQPGDPVRAAQFIMMLSEQPEPPRNIVIGHIAMEAATKRLRAKLSDYETWHDQAVATDFPRA